MEAKTKNSNSKQNDWKNLVQSFVTNILERVEDNVSKKVHEFMIRLKRRTFGAVLIFIGSIFFLVGISLFINALFGNTFPWLGWTISGFIVLLTGYLISKD